MTRFERKLHTILSDKRFRLSENIEVNRELLKNTIQGKIEFKHTHGNDRVCCDGCWREGNYLATVRNIELYLESLEEKFTILSAIIAS